MFFERNHIVSHCWEFLYVALEIMPFFLKRSIKVEVNGEINYSTKYVFLGVYRYVVKSSVPFE